MNKKTTSKLIAEAYKENNEELYWNIISEIHTRGTITEFNTDILPSE